ncbi:hypothetical protein X927_00260 [Petrotoga mexicana DSM 14811]|uniref:Uncharacterized protein n=1 Tax=Petrotoga mexicana DSM 14811 TaxID=1122954 RepID=A0A2K1PFL2_9BACT|nr:hypothetical protein X927_00260 [Petrotoga mexicana DSM 14811]
MGSQGGALPHQSLRDRSSLPKKGTLLADGVLIKTLFLTGGERSKGELIKALLLTGGERGERALTKYKRSLQKNVLKGVTGRSPPPPESKGTAGPFLKRVRCWAKGSKYHRNKYYRRQQIHFKE